MGVREFFHGDGTSLARDLDGKKPVGDCYSKMVDGADPFRGVHRPALFEYTEQNSGSRILVIDLPTHPRTYSITVLWVVWGFVA